jgi:hypothetical protein
MVGSVPAGSICLHVYFAPELVNSKLAHANSLRNGRVFVCVTFVPNWNNSLIRVNYDLFHVFWMFVVLLVCCDMPYSPSINKTNKKKIIDEGMGYCNKHETRITLPTPPTKEP